MTLAPGDIPVACKDARSQRANFFRRNRARLDREAGHLSGRDNGFQSVGELLPALETLLRLFREAPVDHFLKDG